MKGQILDFSVQENKGTITTSSGTRYYFAGKEWKGQSPPTRGMGVDFEVEGTDARAVYASLGGTQAGSKDRVAAGVLAILLGSFGVHKFYLGFTGAGIIMLAIGLTNVLVNTFGWAVTWLVLFIPNILFGLAGFALFVIGVVEGIIYLTRTDEEFNQIYLVEKRKWF
jgi:TM2 domain-containing membrane protein YozV